MFQAGFGHLPAMWAIRAHPKVCKLFKEVFNALRGKEDIGQLLSSADGLNMLPPPGDNGYTPADKEWTSKHPGAVNPKGDWPHTDQVTGPVDKYVQGQVVLNDTSACFVCSPKSHTLFPEIQEALNKKLQQSTGQKWFKLSKPEEMDVAARVVESHGGAWQIPIYAPAGSVILWHSYTIHSAKRQDKDDDRWRCVVYVSHRPRSELPKAHKNTLPKRLRKCWDKNRMTNHTGERMFSTTPGGRFAASKVYNKQWTRYIKTPTAMWEDHPKLRTKLTSIIASLTTKDMPIQLTSIRHTKK